MCGRFTLRFDPDELLDAWGIDQIQFEWQKRWNVAPGQPVPVLVSDPAKGARIGLLNWGLIPEWHPKDKPVKPYVNAKRETLHEKPSFRHLIARRRCVIPADGWYEWQPDDPDKVPHWIHHPDRPILAFAGLYDRWSGQNGQIIHTCTVITMEASPVIQKIHHRMPLLLTDEERMLWAEQTTEWTAVRQMLQRPAPGWTSGLQTRKVSKNVNSSRNDHEHLWEESGGLW